MVGASAVLEHEVPARRRTNTRLKRPNHTVIRTKHDEIRDERGCAVTKPLTMFSRVCGTKEEMLLS